MKLTGVTTHNLNNITVTFPEGTLTAVTGVSGSGKSSLVFDTLYAESRLRFLESLSPYLRQFLEKWPKPDLASAEGLLPAMAIRGKKTVKSSRSTVATLTDIADHFRLLFARFGTRHCPTCGAHTHSYDTASVIAWCASHLDRVNGYIVQPFASLIAADLTDDLQGELSKAGVTRLFHQGKIRRLDTTRQINPGTDAVLARISISSDSIDELKEMLGLSSKADGDFIRLLIELPPTDIDFSSGNIMVEHFPDYKMLHFPLIPYCTACQQALPQLHAGTLSFNHAEGACPECKGFGDVIFYDPRRYLDQNKTLRQNPVLPWSGKAFRAWHRALLTWAQNHGVDLDTPLKDLAGETQQSIVDGGLGFPGVRAFFRKLERKKYRMHLRVFLSRFRSFRQCPTCSGKRLNPLALSIRLGGKDLGDILAMTAGGALHFLRSVSLPKSALSAGGRLIEELESRLECLIHLGVGYLTLDRLSFTLSGGELQRINLSAAVGNRLADTLFILDEPTMGLHARDVARLGNILDRLAHQGNTVVFVEHDPDCICLASGVIDLGPGAGADGGNVVFQGSLKDFLRCQSSITARWLQRANRKRQRPQLPPPSSFIDIRQASGRNLQGINARVPLRQVTCITGVSGSGKTTLLEDVLLPGIESALTGLPLPPTLEALTGGEELQFVRYVDQSLPTGTGRSSPATYLGFFTAIREQFAHQTGAKVHGRSAGFFSTNIDGGRCSLCKGRGRQILEMQFLAEEEVLCEACLGTGYSAEALQYTLNGLNIAKVLELTVDEGFDFFEETASMHRSFELLQRSGLGYLRLGQPLDTLSGGEAQRLKLCRALADLKAGQGLFLFDEPTTGLHPADTCRLLTVLDQLLAQGHTVVAVEHDLFFLENADWVIDLGPEGGDGGGMLLYQGPVDRIVQCEHSHTGRALQQWRLGMDKQKKSHPKNTGTQNCPGKH